MQVKVRRVDNIVCMIVLGCRGEEVYDGCREGFYVCKYVEVSLYVGLYEDVEIYYRHVVGGSSYLFTTYVAFWLATAL